MHATPAVSRCSTVLLPNHRFSLALVFAAGVLGLMLLAPASTQAQQAADEPPKVSAAGAEAGRTIHQFGRLELRQPVEHEIAGGQTHEFTVEVQAGQFVHAIAEQKGIDVVLSIFDPSNSVVVSADSPNASLGPEPASIIANSAGTYRLRVAALVLTAPAGRYSLEITELRKPQEQDKLRMAAEKKLFEAAALLGANADSKRKALELLRQAMGEWHSLHDQYEEGLTAQALGSIYDDLGEKQKALEYYQLALPIRRAVGDRGGEAATLNNIGSVYSDLGEKQKALEHFQLVLLIERAVGNPGGEATILNNIGMVHADFGEPQKALEYYQQALLIRRAVADRGGEATILHNVALVYSSVGEPQKALEYFQQALPIWRVVGHRRGEALTLSSIGSVYSSLGERQKALEYFQQALPIERALGDRGGEGATLNNIGMVHADSGEPQKALEYYQQALPIDRAVGDHRGEAATLSNIGSVYSDLGEKQKALEYLQQALPIRRAMGDRRGEASSLNNIGSVFSDLGEKQKALEYYQLALPIRRAVGDRGGEAATLHNIGGVYDNLGETQKALEYFQQALLIRRAVGDRAGEAVTLNNLGWVYDRLGNKQKALEYFQQALPIWRAVGHRRGEALTLNNIGWVYYESGEKQKALECYQQTMLIRRAVGDREGEANTLFLLSRWWEEQHNSSLAVFFGKQAVNIFQNLRRDIQGLDKNIQKTYLRTITGAYRSLADLLLAEGRLPEAEQVLGMLKEQEFKEFTRGAATTPASTRTAPLTASEQHAESILAQALEWQTLDKTPNRSADQQARYQQVSAALKANNVSLANYWQALQTALPQREAREAKVEASATQKLLRQLPAGTVVVYTLVLEDRLDLIVIRPEAMAQKSVAVPRTEVAATVEQFRAAIRDRKQGDALQAPARRLYDWMVAPIAADLEGAHATTIAWSLDGVLRYMPVNALYDGRQFLIERYTNVIFTPADTEGLEKIPNVTAWKALGLGVSKQYEQGLNALPAVPGELRTIVRDQQDRDSHGPLPGRILLDDAFTEQALEQQLRQGYPLVHIASHFVMGLGTDESYLLLGGKDDGGGGYRLRLSDLETLQNLSFYGTALLALSACQTAMSSQESDGKEVDSVAAIGRQRGAQAVLASLWDVNDASTGRLMADFYRRWTGTRPLPKAEALRQAQLALLQGKGSGPRDAAKAGRGADRAPSSGDTGPPDGTAYSHPYYWAPFILMGNWQ